MPNGGEHYEQVGFCPHCRSGAIRQRRRLHRSMNWRCGTCTRVFHRPEFREAAVYSNTRYVSEGQVARVESRVARRWNSRRRRRRVRRVNWGLNFWAIMVAVVVVLIAAYFYLAPRLPDQFRLTTIEWLDGTFKSETAVGQMPSPLPPPYLRHRSEKELMLKLINEERTEAGLSPVTLGNNVAAQLPAESSLENCTSSHWGTDGLEPYI